MKLVVTFHLPPDWKKDWETEKMKSFRTVLMKLAESIDEASIQEYVHFSLDKGQKWN